MSRTRIGIAILLVCAVAFVSTALFAQDNSAREKNVGGEVLCQVF